MECQVRDIAIHYEEVGAGRPLIALHGLPLDHRHVFDDLEALFGQRQGWRRIYPDLPGMGQTRPAEWITHQDHMLDVVLGFIDVVAPDGHFVLAGASYGSYLARAVAYRWGARLDGLMLYVPVMKPPDQRANLPERVVLKQDQAYLDALTTAELDLHDWIVVQSTELLQDVRKSILVAPPLADQQFLQRLFSNYAFSFDVNSLLEPFLAPCLFLTGRQDNWCGYRDAYELLEDYPRATYVVLDRAGHGLAIEQKSLFRALVGEWLDRVEEYAKQYH